MDGVLGAQTEAQSDRLLSGERVEIENCLSRGERELLKAAALPVTGLLLKGLQVFAQQLEAGGIPRSTITMFAVFDRLLRMVAVAVAMSFWARRVRS